MEAVKSIYLLALVLMTLTSCQKQEPDNANKEVVFTKSQLVLLNSSNQFGFNLFRKLTSDSTENKNIFISPLSISMALTMAYNGADEKTASDMQKTLGFEGLSTESINEASKEMMQTILNIDPKITMEIANSIWYSNLFPVKQEFLNVNKTYFDAEVNSCDFSNLQTVDLINAWVNKKTHGKIEKIIQQLDPLEVVDLINAIYFNGYWKFKFDPKDTENKPFYQENGTISQADFMAMKGTFKYLKNDTLSALELPYGGGGISMLLLLPDEGIPVRNICSVLTQQKWDSWNNRLDSTDIFLHLPKFKFKYDIGLKDALISLGMGEAFDENKADFSGISDNKLYISEVLHKTFVDVNESGTEAAAVTIVRFFTTSIDGPSYKDFNVNRPFIFMMKENSTNSIIFMGLVTKPVIE